MATKLLIPILNQQTTTSKGPTWYPSENVAVETISSEDFGTILSYTPEEYKAMLSSKTKCIRIADTNPSESEKVAHLESQKIAFLLNFFKHLHPVALSFAVQISKKRKPIADQIIALPIISDARLQRINTYKVKENARREDMSDFYHVVTKVYEKHP